MAACRLNPFLATPFSGRGIIRRPIGWAVEAFHKASFSAERVTEVSAEVYQVCWLLTLQFFDLGGILHAQSFICLQLHEKNESAIKNTYYLAGENFHFHLFKFNIRPCYHLIEKIFTYTNIFPDALLFGFFCFGHQY